MKRADTKMMREINKNYIRNSFRSDVDSTASQLSKKTGLSVVTVNALLKEMIESKEIFVGESVPSNGGRPSTVYYYNDMFRCSAIIFGFTIGGKNYIKILVTNLLGESIYEEKYIFKEISCDSFNNILDGVFNKYPTIEVIAFGLPGAEENGVITINDYPNIVGDIFMKHYKGRYKVPVIFINDINAAVNGYYHNKLDNNYMHTVVGLVFNRVHLPGAGIVINGDIHTGKSNFAGEFSYMPIDIDWINIDYYDSEVVSDCIGKLISIMSCIIAPDQFVLYGDFFGDDSEKLIKEKAERILNNKFEINIVTSKDFERDYELGMIKSALDVLNNCNEILK